MSDFSYTDRLMNNIRSNDELKSFFIDSIKNNRLAHAFIIEGGKGCGKYTLSLTVCACLADNERNARLIMENNCTDINVISVEEGKRLIGIAAIRSIRESVFVKANDLEFKAYIIRNAEQMTVQAQNALLKLLEEPPRNVFFFLLCENSSLLLPTVRSRALSLRMKGLSPDEIDAYLTASLPAASELKKKDASRYEKIVNNACGSLGNAISAIENNGIDGASELDEAVLRIFGLIADNSKAQFFLAVNSLPAKRETLLSCLSSFMLALRDMLCVRYSGPCDLFFGHSEQICGLAERFTASQLISAYDIISGINDGVQANINIQNAKTALALGLWKLTV